MKQLQDIDLFWHNVSTELQQLITPDAYNRWFTQIRPMSLEGNCLCLGVENSIFQYWIEENYMPQLRSASTLIAGKEMDVVLRAGISQTPQPPAKEEKTSTEKEKLYNNGIVDRYTFDTFVVGANNQFAHAAAVAISNSPGRTYNPLFVHGSVGLGKTHLLHAVANRLMLKKKNPKIIYVTSERFANEFIDAIQKGELARFRKKYRGADALFIDDIQFLAGKERSQEEFFHTFNALFEGSKQIVLSSDRPPADIQNLESRLVSRFEWGLTAQLEVPDIETRLAILRQKNQTMPLRLGESVLSFIAQRVKSNVRRLEGALNRVAAWASLNNRHITREQVDDILADLIELETSPVVTIDDVQKCVAEGFGIRLADMTSKRRPAKIAIPRMAAMYLSRKLTGRPLQEIGKAFGGRDHGTVLHAVRAIEEKMTADAELQRTLQIISEKIKTES